nr:hypothetical protein [uncultured Albidiferax sp.]
MTDKNQPNNEPTLPNIYKGEVGNVLFLFGVVMFGVFIASAYMIAEHREAHPFASITLGAVWVVGVPLFFFIEHTVLFRKYGDKSQYDQFKRAQELASKIWAGAIVVLAAFFAQTFPK